MLPRSQNINELTSGSHSIFSSTVSLAISLHLNDVVIVAWRNSMHVCIYSENLNKDYLYRINKRNQKSVTIERKIKIFFSLFQAFG